MLAVEDTKVSRGAVYGVFGAAGDDDAGGAGWCGVELVTVRLGVCGYLQLSRRVSPSLFLSLSVSLALCNISKAWLWKVTEGAAAVAAGSVAGDRGLCGGRGCISLYIQLKSTIYT